MNSYKNSNENVLSLNQQTRIKFSEFVETISADAFSSRLLRVSDSFLAHINRIVKIYVLQHDRAVTCCRICSVHYDRV